MFALNCYHSDITDWNPEFKPVYIRHAQMLAVHLNERKKKKVLIQNVYFITNNKSTGQMISNTV